MVLFMICYDGMRLRLGDHGYSLRLFYLAEYSETYYYYVFMLSIYLKHYSTLMTKLPKKEVTNHSN